MCIVKKIEVINPAVKIIVWVREMFFILFSKVVINCEFVMFCFASFIEDSISL